MGKEKTSCPRCGKSVRSLKKSSDVDTHRCVTPTTYRMRIEKARLERSTPVVQDHPRVVECPECRYSIDVTLFDPLDKVSCSFCKKDFSLLENFEGYKLLRSFDAGWHKAVYLGRENTTGTSAIIKVLSSHVLSQPDAVHSFQQELEVLRAGFLDPFAKEIRSGQFCGFQYAIIPLLAKLNESELLVAAGVNLNKTETDLLSAGQNRQVACTLCQTDVDVSKYNLLDQVKCPHCSDHFELLQKFGDYRIDYRLNVGGSSVLYLAHSSKLDRDVALKVLSAAEMMERSDSIPQFIQECIMTSKLVHPNLIQVYDYGCVNGFYYMALELVEGLSLDEVLRAIHVKVSRSSKRMTRLQKIFEIYDKKRDRFKESLPELIALEIILQAAMGLGVAHDNNLVHGDIKPDNIMVTYEGIVKVLDFGLVNFANAEKSFQEGESNAIYGTPLYLPPERMREEPEDFRSDIYGLGATLYHLLRGFPPFTGTSPLDIALKQVNAPSLSFKVFAPWVSDTTCRIVEKSLKKVVSERYSSHFEFVSDLTFAKNEILHAMAIKKIDGRTLLKPFICSLPHQTSSRTWQRAKTSLVRTYRYVTKAIWTKPFNSKIPKSK
jgi:serine/threonine protein kinase